MDYKVVATAFLTLFLAEMGDKTQLAVLTLSASSGRPLSVFAGAAAALVAVSGLGALFGGAVTRVVSPQALHKAAAAAFIGIGAWMLLAPEK